MVRRSHAIYEEVVTLLQEISRPPCALQTVFLQHPKWVFNMRAGRQKGTFPIRCVNNPHDEIHKEHTECHA